MDYNGLDLDAFLMSPPDLHQSGHQSHSTQQSSRKGDAYDGMKVYGMQQQDHGDVTGLFGVNDFGFGGKVQMHGGDGESYGADQSIGHGLDIGGSASKFDPNDYAAQGLDRSALTGAIPFKMPGFLMGGPAGDFSEGPAVLEPPSAPQNPIPQQSLSLDTPRDSGPGPPKDRFNPNSSSPVFGMYGSSVVGVQADARPFKKIRSTIEEPSFVQRNDDYRQRPAARPLQPHQSGSSASSSATPGTRDSRDAEGTFDASHLGLPAPIGGNFPGLYSESGFDLLGVLARVVARPNPTINVGPVDTSASFVVCDARRYDYPIVFASKTFSHLTGYESSEILGRNCRFLQSPTGCVDKGSKRKDTDGRAVSHMQKHVDSAKECQASLINYRKNGEPFINLITIVPITWDSDEITYFVGFQVNLIEQPNAILDRMKNGTYVINYTLLPEPPGGFEPAREVQPEIDTVALEKREAKRHRAQIASSNEAMNKLGDAMADDAESRKHWFETLIEQCDDMVHVLSLKGSLLYVSPAVERILGYTPGELLGKNLQGICHPSDWIAVMRELKESSNGDNPNVHLLYRVRRKNAGFVWIESQGRLYNENGKGRKCVILLARERPVYRMSWTEIQESGGLGEDEVWYKVSLDGTYLYVAPSIKRVLDFESTTMVGTNIKQTMPSEFHSEYLQLVSQAAAGAKCSLRHRIFDRSHSHVEVVTHFWPCKPNTNREGQLGDELPESNFVICQMNELKSEIRRVNSAREYAGQARPTSSSHSSYSGTPALVAREVPSTTPTGGQTFAPQAPAFSAVPSTYKFMRGHPAAKRDNVFNDLDTAHSSSWLYEIHLLENLNRKLAEERDALLAARSRRKRTFSEFQSNQSSASDSPPAPRACANCGKMNSPEWRRGPGGTKSLCNACGLRWSKAQHQASSATSTSSSSATTSSNESVSRMSNTSGSAESPAAVLDVPPYHPHLQQQGSQGAFTAHSISPGSGNSSDSYPMASHLSGYMGFR